jgi:hypothetical protein
VGSVIRRVLPSLAVTLAIFAAIRVAIGVFLRPHFMTPVIAHAQLLRTSGAPAGAWIISQGLLSPSGRSLGAGIDFSQFPAACRTVTPEGKGLLGQCLASHGFRQVVTYQPDGRFWAFQGIEAGIFVLLAAALVGFAMWWVLHRDA